MGKWEMKTEKEKQREEKKKIMISERDERRNIRRKEKR